VDWSKTPLNAPHQTEVNMSTDLNRNFVFRLNLNLKLQHNAQSHPKGTDPMSYIHLLTF